MSDNEKYTPGDEIPGGNAELDDIVYGGQYSEYEDELGQQESDLSGRMTTFSQTGSPDAAKPVRTDSRRKLILIITLCAVIAASALFLFLFRDFIFGKKTVDRPLEAGEGYLATKSNIVKLYKEEGTDDRGEQINSSGRVLIFEYLPRESIQSIEVRNKNGSYTAYYNKDLGSFCFEGLEGAPYDENLFAQLVVSAGYSLVADRFLKTDERADLSEYGLGEGDDASYFIVTSRKTDTEEQRSYKVYIGKPSLTENYYYCKLDGRDVVYILEQSIGTTLLSDVRSFLTPILTYPIEDSSYLTSIPQIAVYKNSELFVYMQKRSSEELSETESQTGSTIPYVVMKPVEYNASTDNLVIMLQQIVNISGTSVLEYSIYEPHMLTDENGDPALDENGEQNYEYVIKPEIAEKYGLGEPAAYGLFYRYVTAENTVIDNGVTFSAKQYDENGSAFYYAASAIFDTVVKLDASSAVFLDWKLEDYLEKEIFSANIDCVSRIQITTADKSYDFELTGTGSALTAMETANGKTVFKGDDAEAGENRGIRNFRKFYQTILRINREDFTDPEAEGVSGDPVCTLTISFRNGSERKYEFYAYSDRRCFMTINGKGDFYVLRSMLRKLVRDADKLLSYQTVDPNADPDLG